MKRGITQKEIARRLGVSQALVSRALTGTSAAIDASPATVERIRNAATAWHYLPNAAALSLKGAPTRTLGVIVKTFDDPFFGHMIGVLQGLAREQRYALLLVGWEEGNPSPADETILWKYRPDALIVCGSDYDPPAIRLFLESGKPVVQIGLGKAAPGVRQVAMDEEAGLASLVSYLVGLGHTRIGYVGDASLSLRRREAILREVLSARGLAVHPEWFVGVEAPSDAAVKAAVGRLLSLGPGKLPGVVIAADDVMAQRVLRSLYEHGVRVPSEMSLAGLDDIPAVRTLIPALTSVRQPIPEMVRHAFRMVTEPGGPADATAPARVVVVPELAVRESCAAPATGNGT